MVGWNFLRKTKHLLSRRRFWDNAIPNQGCQAAYDVSGAFPFVQRNEISANVQKYRDMAAFKAVVKDGDLCSAGDKAKAGLNVPSAHLQNRNYPRCQWSN